MSRTVEIRPAREADLPAIVRLLGDDDLGSAREAAEGGALPAGYAGALAAIDADPNQLLVVAELDGSVVGTFQLSFLPGISRRGAWRAQIEAVRVDRPLRGGGLGRQMMEWAIAEARRRGCRLVQLTSDKRRSDAHRFYAGLGFEATHEGMKLRLSERAAP